ncbi:MAG: hypothetical protein JW807_08255 [Spirochaetes bacterium]|nr:hypothetical protein [Spirochaetota bacterium]
MADLMKEQKQYLEARLRECETAPELNKNQIAEYHNYLELLASSKDAAEYADRVAAAGDMFSVSLAEQADRYENGLKIKELFGDEAGAAAERIMIDAVNKSTGHTELYNAVAGASARRNDMINASRQAVEQVLNLFTALVHYRTACASRKKGKKSDVRAVWDKLKSLDPDVTYEKIVSYPPYRSVLPPGDERLRLMGTWLKEAIG